MPDLERPSRPSNTSTAQGCQAAGKGPADVNLGCGGHPPAPLLPLQQPGLRQLAGLRNLSAVKHAHPHHCVVLVADASTSSYDGSQTQEAAVRTAVKAEATSHSPNIWRPATHTHLGGQQGIYSDYTGSLCMASPSQSRERQWREDDRILHAQGEHCCQWPDLWSAAMEMKLCTTSWYLYAADYCSTIWYSVEAVTG